MGMNAIQKESNPFVALSTRNFLKAGIEMMNQLPKQSQHSFQAKKHFM
jgi:hypothetical protein